MRPHLCMRLRLGPAGDQIIRASAEPGLCRISLRQSVLPLTSLGSSGAMLHVMAVKTLTILFSDVVRSTELLARLGDREAERVRAAHYDDMREQVDRFAGTVIKTLGDGLMATFDAARNAIDCAVGMQMESQHQGPGDSPLSIRVGVSTGDVALCDGDCHGLGVVQASRLCAVAGSGQILISASTHQVSGGPEGARTVGPLELKGIPNPVEAWEVPWTPEAPAKVRAVLADDAVLVREGIAHVLEAAGIEVVAQASDGEELVRLAAELRPDIAIVDVRMPPTHTTEGLDAAERMRAHNPHLGLMVLSQEVESASAGRLLKLGETGVGYLLKERVANLREFADAVRRVAAGGTAFEASVTSSLNSEGRGLAEHAVG